MHLSRIAGVKLFYDACRPVMAALLWTLSDFHLEGREHVPLEGPLIVVSNHLHFADPPLLGGVLPRYIRFMAKQETFKAPFGWVFAHLYGAFAVKRGQADRQALRESERILASGGVLGMFPEGHRSHGRGLQPAFDGVALLARRSGAPLLPVGIAGTERVFKAAPKWPIAVRIGEPFSAPSGCSLRETTDVIMRKVAELLPERYRGVYAMHPMAPVG